MRKLLLDENLPRPLKHHFSNQVEILTVPDLGWTSKKNGELIAAMVDEEIEYLITVDQNLEYQQNLEKYPIKLVVILSYTNRLKDLIPKVSFIEKCIDEMAEGQKLLHVDIRD
ncbi:MAG: hypothetical protein AAGI38_04095 [Bacteroidota bacterium]